MTTTGPGVRLVSFGYLHSPPPTAVHVEDVRDSLHDPARIQHLLDSDGRDPRVQNVVLATPGVDRVIAKLAEVVSDQSIHSVPVIAIGCAGGRHRSAALAELVAIQLRAVGYQVDVTHRDIHLPRVLRDTNTVH